MIAAGLLTVDMLTPNGRSLKEKRQVLNSLKDRLRRRFNVSVAETDYHDKWQRSQLSIVGVARDRVELEARLTRVLNFLEGELKITILDHKLQALR